jgi:signal transduction histidine kinase
VNEVPAGIEVFADPLIVKVFCNLMNNAVNHGETTASIRFCVDDQNGVRSIVCGDDGVGIAEGMKQKLFTKGFGKDHGLGLFLSRRFWP